MNPTATKSTKNVSSAQDLLQSTAALLEHHQSVHDNVPRVQMIQDCLSHREAIESECGALATWNPADSTGRIPKDTYMVRDHVTEKSVDWDAAACIPMLPEVFDDLWRDALETFTDCSDVYITDRTIGADAAYALPTRVIASSPLTALFTDNMFRPMPDDIATSIFGDQHFTMLVLPHDKVQAEKYAGILRDTGNGTSDMLVVMDFERHLGLVYGSSYCGCVKKLMFTTMNYLLPAQNILPLHCSANENAKGDSALFLGLSGTGKTTVSNDPERTLIVDDECGWSNAGIANLENGCYAKMIHLNPEKEPEIYKAVFGKRPVTEHGCIVENAMVYPDGTFDLDDDRFAENSRASYPNSLLKNAKESAVGDHPQTIIFLTADAHGVLPPIAKLTSAQAMLWFLMGYTSKLAGTETGITKPQSAFSRFFGAPFMPCHPRAYSDLLGTKMADHGTDVYLVNTGWTGGAYGTGERIDITLTRAMVTAALDGKLADVPYRVDERFKFFVPESCPDVDAKLLNPQNTWENQKAFAAAADALAEEFAAHFEKEYSSSDLDAEVREACPGL